MKKFLLKIWRIMPEWMEWIASAIVRPHYRVGVHAIILNEQGQILLCWHTYRRLHPWGLPGGGLNLGEDPAEAVRRELREETGLSVQATRFLLVHNSKKSRIVNLFYKCTGVSGTFVQNEEVSRIQYFEPSALPVLPQEQQGIIDKALEIIHKEAGCIYGLA